jgi:hypothetical protein
VDVANVSYGVANAIRERVEHILAKNRVVELNLTEVLLAPILHN